MKKNYITPHTSCVGIVGDAVLTMGSLSFFDEFGTAIPYEEPAESEALSRKNRNNDIWDDEELEDDGFGYGF